MKTHYLRTEARRFLRNILSGEHRLDECARSAAKVPLLLPIIQKAKIRGPHDTALQHASQTGSVSIVVEHIRHIDGIGVEYALDPAICEAFKLARRHERMIA
jgi:hypothetical protein